MKDAGRGQLSRVVHMDEKGRNTLKLTKVLERPLLLVALRGLAVHEVVKALAVLENVVKTAHDAEDTKGEYPDTDDGNDVGHLAADKPTPDGEARGDDVDNEDSTSELPRGDGRPEGTVGTGDEDQPVLSKGDLKEDDSVDLTVVLDDTTVLTVHIHGGDGDEGTDGQDNTEKDGHSPELGQVPLNGRLGVRSVVVGDGQGGNIGKDGDESDQVDVERLVEGRNQDTKVDLQVDGKSDTVNDVGVHTVENLARSLEGVDDGTKTGGKEDDISSRAGGVRGTLDSDTGISLLQRRSVVDTITSHGNQVTTLLQNLDDVVLVLGENLGETVGGLNEIVDLRAGHVTATTKTQALSIVDVGTKTELARGLTSDADSITSKHLDGQTQVLGLIDSAGGIVAGRVRAGHDTKDLPGTLAPLAGDTERTESTGSKLRDLVLVVLVDGLGDLVVLLDGLEHKQRSTLDAGDDLTLGRLDNSGNLLGDGVEGVELKDLVLGQGSLGAGVVLERLQESLVNGVHTLLLAGGSETGSKHEVFGLDTGDGVGLRERELVLGQSTSLVGAKNLDTSKGLDGTELLNDSLLLGEVGGTDSHGGGDDSGKTDGHTNDGDGQGELKDLNNGVVAVERGDPDDQVGEDDQDQENCTDAVEHLGEVTATGGGSVDKGGSATDEGAVTSGGDDNKSLTTLDGGRSIALVALVLVDSKRLASDGRLINLEIGIVGDNATVGGNDGTLLNLKNVTGDDLGSLDLLELTVTEDDSLQGESLLQLVDDGTSLELLDETNTSVKQH
ncbi:hypothetical protein PpBr36_01840 [Pyricularia pennisetigena]|uniref:hypothetical protein n=1 Tax=Pyricularia pennisetigena TaxID=1578925 RepID=UPI001153D80E|nr:hypothetical protein PpBr36_01840 [Pyricularia pennisetigena]TLS28806.1 hypothetical protein PpBr36_01840 [Pyricularia pennisetigena]